MKYNKKYSFGNFTGQSFKHLSPDEFNNTIIKGSAFYQQNKPYSDIFPDGLVNVEFHRCNLNNVMIPHGTIVKDSCNLQIMVQNDRDDWLVDKELNPIEPLNKDLREPKGINTDPKNLPKEKITKQAFEEYQRLLRGVI